MKQIPLDVRLADHAVFDTWFPGRNGALLHAVREAAVVQTYSVFWIWGAPGCGKTHLLQACVNEAYQRGQTTTYIPVDPVGGLDPAMLENMGGLDVVCVDAIDRVAGHRGWEQAMFGLFEQVRQRGARLIMAAEKPPLHCAFALPDLVSRFTSGATFRVHQLSDDDKILAMQLRARWRGLELPDEVARFLFARIERSNPHLFDMLDRLDTRALAEKKRLTIPLVRALLADERANSAG